MPSPIITIFWSVVYLFGFIIAVIVSNVLVCWQQIVYFSFGSPQLGINEKWMEYVTNDPFSEWGFKIIVPKEE